MGVLSTSGRFRYFLYVTCCITSDVSSNMRIRTIYESDLCRKSRFTHRNEKMDLLNFMASNIENFVVTLSSLENQLKLYDNNDDISNEVRDLVIIDTYDDDMEDELDREGIYKSAVEDAKMSDSQGYMVSPSSSLGCIDIGQKQRSIQDLTAISWAVFCSSEEKEDKTVTIRIQALDSSKLLDRLYMGLFVLREKKKDLEEKLALVGRRKRQQLDDN